MTLGSAKVPLSACKLAVAILPVVLFCDAQTAQLVGKAVGAEDTGVVRRGTGLPQQETDFLKTRLPRVGKALSKILDVAEPSLEDTPIMGAACSGGGYRAMIACVGFWDALRTLNSQKHVNTQELLSYGAGVSGGTWALASYLAWPEATAERWLTGIKEQLTRGLFNLTLSSSIDVAKYVWDNKANQSRDIELWGALLADKIFWYANESGKTPLSLTMEDTQKQIDSGDVPWPIWTALELKGKQVEDNQSLVWEVTYAETGSAAYAAWIPQKLIGATIHDGKVQPGALPFSLADLVAICGSGFAISAYDACVAIFTGPSRALCSVFHSSASRIPPAHMPNPFFGIEQGDAHLPIPTQDHLQFLDSGFMFNLPVGPLMRSSRKVDALLIMDSSDEVGGLELKKSERWAKENGYGDRWPAINYTGITDEYLSIFESDEMMIFYIPLRNCSNETAGEPSAFIPHKYPKTKFNYEPQQVDEIADGVGCALTARKQKFEDALKRLYLKKQKTKYI